MDAGLRFKKDKPSGALPLILLRVSWLSSLAFFIFDTLWNVSTYSQRIRFNRLFEDSYSYFKSLITYAGYLQVIDALVFSLTIFYLLVAVYIFIRRPSDQQGIMTSIALMGIPTAWFWASDEMGWIRGVVTLIWVYAFSCLLFTFPNGKFLPKILSRGFQYLFLVMVFGVYLGVWNEWLFAIPLVSLAFLWLGGILSQVYRFMRVSTLPEKQQTKWVFTSLLLLVFWVVFTTVNPGEDLRFEARAPYGFFLVVLGFVVVLMFPVSFAISILRYRLFDIDLIIRRTLQYGALTSLLAGFYYLMIVVLQTGVRAVTGQAESPFITVISTLLIAALFNPLRLRLQEFINRRFYRKSYNAELLLQGFSESARNEVDIQRLAESILAVAETAMQPEKSSMFLRERD